MLFCVVAGLQTGAMVGGLAEGTVDHKLVEAMLSTGSQACDSWREYLLRDFGFGRGSACRNVLVRPIEFLIAIARVVHGIVICIASCW